MNTMLFLAASALDKLKQVPPSIWWKVGFIVLAFFVLVFVLKLIAQSNKMLLGIAAFVIGGVVFFSWIYNRNEPAFLSPLVDKLAPFFPSAGAYERSAGKAPAPANPKDKPVLTTTTTIPSKVY
jgi:hypothetical protein